MQLFNFKNCKVNNKMYGGSERKIGVTINGKDYMLKFRKQTPLGERMNDISEYLGSHIYQMLGFDCQETFLGTYEEKNVVACKDFICDGFIYVPFNDVGESSLEIDKELYQYEYDDIVKLLESNQKLTNVSETISIFFEMFIVDALIGNFDRHGANWGFLKKDNKYKLAPVFDNGSCLFPNLTDEGKMKYIIDNEEEINERVYHFPTSQIKLNGKKSSYFEVISSLKYNYINNALLKIYPLIDLDSINKLIDDIDIISDLRKEFYKVMIKNRYEKIIEFSYLKLVGDKHERI